MARRGLRLGATLLIVVWTSSAWAQAPTDVAPTADAASAPVPPDVVILNNGGMYRGTISQLVPGDHVEILVVGGDKQRFPMSDVKYAGPASGVPGATAPPAPAPPPAPASAPPSAPPLEARAPASSGARVSLVGEPEGLTFQRQSPGPDPSTPAYADLCTVPCELSVPAGTYTFALGVHGQGVAEAAPVELPTGASTLHGRYESNQVTRTTGLVFLIAGPVGGALVVLTTVGGESRGSGLLAGGVVAGVGVVVGLMLMGKPDTAAVTVHPATSAALHPRLVAGADLDRLSAPRADALPGLSVAARF